MAYLNWTNEFSVENTSIDEQHKQLFKIINDLHASMKEGKSKEIMVGLLTRLVDYTQTHFSNEEKLMEKYKYPDLIKHKTEHAKLITKVLDYQKNFNIKSAITSIDIMNFLKDWLTNHILVTDKKYAPYLKGKG